jgi:hypothetical protein
MRTKYGIEVKIPETPLQGDPALEACWLATDILWYLLDISETGSESTLQCYLKKLKAAVSKVSRATWITCASEPFLWVALIGAAAAPDQPNRIWFTTLHGCMPSSILTKDVSAYQDFWQYFCWVRDLRRFKMQPVLDISEVDDTYDLADTRDMAV